MSNSRTVIIFIVCFIAIVVYDSTVVKFSAHSRINLPSFTHVVIFALLTIMFVLISAVLLFSVWKNTANDNYSAAGSLKYTYNSILGVQILSSVILLAINLQMIFNHSYSIMYLYAVTYVSHLSALAFVSYLVLRFITWSKSNKNYIIILFATAFLFISATIIFSMLYLQIQFDYSLHSNIKPSSFQRVIITHPIPNVIGPLGTFFDIFSLLSFLTIWAATLLLLSKYRFRIGKVKYFVLITIPLIYYIFPFESYFGNIFAPIKLISPIIFEIVYLLIFSATKQVGALLFSLSFWTASALVVGDRARTSLILCAIGMVILFGSLQINTLQYTLYPPYGLITLAFLPLGSYLFLIGISSSAKIASRDAELRKQIHKSAESQLNLLKTIGAVEMEKELITKYKSLEKSSNKLEKDDDEPIELEDVKEIVRDVLNELQSRESNTTKKDAK